MRWLAAGLAAIASTAPCAAAAEHMISVPALYVAHEPRVVIIVPEKSDPRNLIDPADRTELEALAAVLGGGATAPSIARFHNSHFFDITADYNGNEVSNEKFNSVSLVSAKKVLAGCSPVVWIGLGSAPQLPSRSLAAAQWECGSTPPTYSYIGIRLRDHRVEAVYFHHEHLVIAAAVVPDVVAK